MEPDWEAVAEAAVRAEYPRLPAMLPQVVASLLPVWAERIREMDPTVQQEQLGAWMATYGTSWLTEPERAVLRPYARRRVGTVEIGTDAAGQPRSWPSHVEVVA